MLFLIPSPVHTVPFPDNFFVNRSPSMLAPKVPNNMLKNSPFYSLVSFLIVFVTPFSNILQSSKAWTILIMSFMSLFEITKIIIPEPYIFLNTRIFHC